MNQKQKTALENIRAAIAKETHPERLSKEDYLEVIEEIQSDLEGAAEATRGELLDE